EIASILINRAEGIADRRLHLKITVSRAIRNTAPPSRIGAEQRAIIYPIVLAPSATTIRSILGKKDGVGGAIRDAARVGSQVRRYRGIFSGVFTVVIYKD